MEIRMVLSKKELSFLLKSIENVISNNPDIGWEDNLEKCLKILKKEEDEKSPEDLSFWVKNHIS